MLSLLYRAADRLRHQRRQRVWSSDQATGRHGEDLAHRYLRRLGYFVVARNYRARSGVAELDLIAWDGDKLVIVEVKTRSSDEFGAPDRAMDAVKRQHLFRAGSEYCRRAGVPWEQARFDVVSVTLGQPVSLNHMKDVYPVVAK